MEQTKKPIIGYVVSLVVAIIALLAVAVPIAKAVIVTANLTGIDGTIATYITTFIVLSVLALVASMIGVGMKGN
jgi:hypothetical protein